MDEELLRLLNESIKEENANRTAETRNNKAFLELINYMFKKLKS